MWSIVVYEYIGLQREIQRNIATINNTIYENGKSLS